MEMLEDKALSISDLVDLGRAGSLEARDELVERHVGIVYAEAGGEDDEIISVCFGLLLDAVESFLAREPREGENISGYVKACIGDVRSNSHRGWTKKKADRFRQLDPELLARHTAEGDVDILDQILGCCRNDRERALVIYKSMGWTNEEAARELGISPAGASRAIKAVERRFDCGDLNT